MEKINIKEARRAHFAQDHTDLLCFMPPSFRLKDVMGQPEKIRSAEKKSAEKYLKHFLMNRRLKVQYV